MRAGGKRSAGQPKKRIDSATKHQKKCDTPSPPVPADNLQYFHLKFTTTYFPKKEGPRRRNKTTMFVFVLLVVGSVGGAEVAISSKCQQQMDMYCNSVTSNKAVSFVGL